MKKPRVYFVLFAFAFLILFGSCKKNPPTGPDPGNGQTSTIQIKATINLNGQPLAAVKVYLSGNRSQMTLSETDGSFSFTDLPSGTYYVTFSLKGYSFNPGYHEFSTSIDDLKIAAQTAAFGADIGSIMADFTSKDQNNQDVSLYDFYGQVILIDFSADWCGPCKAESGNLNDLYYEYKNRGFQILTLLISGSNAEWAQTYGLEIPVLDDLKRAVYNIYTNGYVPLNILLGRNCNILYKKDGFNQSEIEELISNFL